MKDEHHHLEFVDSSSESRGRRSKWMRHRKSFTAVGTHFALTLHCTHALELVMNSVHQYTAHIADNAQIQYTKHALFTLHLMYIPSHLYCIKLHSNALFIFHFTFCISRHFSFSLGIYNALLQTCVAFTALMNVLYNAVMALSVNWTSQFVFDHQPVDISLLFCSLCLYAYFYLLI